MTRTLKDIFVAPPISVLDVKQKYWKDRKKEWLSLGIESELGRGENLLKLSSLLQSKQKSTSVFDPVLCECMYRWFTDEDDIVYDPFAGGSVRGIVASKIKRHYFGVDLRIEQIEHNEKQSEKICDSHKPTWIQGSSHETCYDGQVDFIFTCPPYYDLEKYSDIPEDLSNMNKDDFESVFQDVIVKSCEVLKDNRFAAIVIGDVRHNGFYNNFYSRTVESFEKSGLKLYNDMILLQEPATAAMRSFNYMNSSRKIAKCHQNVLVFVKGDPVLATKRMKRFED